MSKATTLTPAISFSTARFAIATATVTLLFLASLHLLSPEFDPAWRMVSEYANGDHGWVLSLMFFAWAISSWTLAATIWSEVKTTAGKVGLYFLISSGIGEAMAALFDINHSLHGLASLIGIGSLPIAAMLISTSLGRTESWSPVKKAMLMTANLTWISVVLMGITFAILIATYTQAGGDMSSTEVPTSLPAGVIALVGWANRFLIVAYCAWVINVAWNVMKIQRAK